MTVIDRETLMRCTDHCPAPGRGGGSGLLALAGTALAALAVVGWALSEATSPTANAVVDSAIASVFHVVLVVVVVASALAGFWWLVTGPRRRAQRAENERVRAGLRAARAQVHAPTQSEVDARHERVVTPATPRRGLPAASLVHADAVRLDRTPEHALTGRSGA